jgi:hypothetical protein
MTYGRTGLARPSANRQNGRKEQTQGRQPEPAGINKSIESGLSLRVCFSFTNGQKRPKIARNEKLREKIQ